MANVRVTNQLAQGLPVLFKDSFTIIIPANGNIQIDDSLLSNYTTMLLSKGIITITTGDGGSEIPYNPGNPFLPADEAHRLASWQVPVGGVVNQLDTDCFYLLTGLPASSPDNWQLVTLAGFEGNITEVLAGKADLVNGKVASSQLPAFVDEVQQYANRAAFPGTGLSNVIYIAQDTNYSYRWTGTTYFLIVSSPGTTDSITEGSTNLYFTVARAQAASLVRSVAGRQGDVVLTKADVNLGNVDNTSDLNKPISTATQTALNGLAPSVRPKVTVSASRNFQASDHRCVLEVSSASVTLTNPGGLPAGFECEIDQLGTSQVTFSGTFNRFGLVSTGGQYARASVCLTSTNVLLLSGDLA